MFLKAAPFLIITLIIYYPKQTFCLSPSCVNDIEIIVSHWSSVGVFYLNLAYVALAVFSLSFPHLLTPYHTAVWDFLACWQASEKHPSPAGSWTSVSIGLWLWLWRLQMESQWELRAIPSKRPGKTWKNTNFFKHSYKWIFELWWKKCTYTIHAFHYWQNSEIKYFPFKPTMIQWSTIFYNIKHF